MLDVKKILILGGPGSGKSRLSFWLGNLLNIPVYHLDDIHINSDVDINGKNERNNKILNILKYDSWIMDGNYRGTLLKRIEHCDIIIFLDYPIYRLYFSIFSRAVKHKFNIEKQFISGNNTFNFKILNLVKAWKLTKRKDVINMLNDYNEKTLIFKSRKKLKKWLKSEFENMKLELKK